MKEAKEAETATKSHRIVVVTPAGRRRYLSILAKYVLRDESIDEWHLWDNCREEADRVYLRKLAESHPKVRIIKEPGVDGTNRSVSKFYKQTRNRDVFYIKLDDDIVFLPQRFAMRLYTKALEEKDSFSWWSPVVINNALCTYLLKVKGTIETEAPITAQANCPIAWGSPIFAENLHRAFLDSLESLGQTGGDAWKLGADYPIFLQRFSINAIGFFGELSEALGDYFCPPNADDEEYISAVLPILTGKPGRIVGDIVVAHFAFYTQEHHLLKSGILERYARLADLSYVPASLGRKNIAKQITHLLKYNFRYLLNEIMGLYLPMQKARLAIRTRDIGAGGTRG